MTLAENSNPQCPVYNVGSDREVEIGELAHIIADIYKAGVTVKKRDLNSFDRYIPSTNKAKEALGLKTIYSLNKAILLS
jgi:nucleoside-diphosphate-sugar epimerase